MDNWQDITDERLVRPIHPGEVIADILDDLDINTAKKALTLGLTHALKTTILCIKVNTLFQAFECHL
jgi:plasmid maintenance system antidote protein VapI